MTGLELDIYIRRRLKITGRISCPPWTGKRSINRVQLAQWFNQFGYKTGAEIGVQKGEYSLVLCESIPGLKLYCVDVWAPYPGMRISQDRATRYMNMAKSRLAPYDATFLVKTSLEASFDVEDNSLDFVYIDASHLFDNVMLDLILWNPKVRSGGMISGHDFFYGDRMGVIPAVTAFTKAHRISHWYITNHTDITKVPSFYWVKP